jgi:hypothetical protein
MRESDQYHFDTTWYKPNGFSQILIWLFHDSISLEKIAGVYVIMNCKYEILYTKIFKSIKNILTQNNILELKVKYLNSDSKYAIYNAINVIFPE